MNRSIILIHVILCLVLSSTFGLKAQHEHPIASQVKEHTQAFENLKHSVLLQQSTSPTFKKILVENELKEGTFFSLQSSTIQSLLNSPQELLKLQFPVNSIEVLELQLFKADIFTEDFNVFAASNPDTPFDYNRGVYYWGIVNGDEHSLCAIGIHENEVAGFASINGETYSIGRLNDAIDNTHILYKNKDLLITPEASCGTDDALHNIGNKVDGFQTYYTKDASNCVKMYVEVDYDIYVGKGSSVTQAANYVSNVFNQVAVLYANEFIDFTVNELKVWDVADPYTGPSTSNYLTQFRNYLNGNYNGDLAHLVGYNGGGGIAYIDVLCNGFYGVGYSAINSSYNNVPTYSWTVEVVTHEIGHNLGSPHTHDCSWNGNNTAIDGCGPAAGYGNSCGGGPLPSSGTIMSYCHLVGGVGIDFNLGFGPQPGDLIRTEVYNATCLTSCSVASSDDAGIASVNVPSGTICANSVSPEVELSNYGTNALTSVTIQYSLDGNSAGSYNWTGNLASNASTTVTLPSINYSNGSHTFAANTDSPNGVADTDASNDSASSSFNRPNDQTFYADNDGDGYGDANNSIVTCIQPNGYVTDNTDCNDNNSSAYPGASCNDGDVCTTGDVLDANCNCSGTYADSDGDGVCDGQDICPGGDDTVDTDGDGTPDFCDCNVASESFSTNPLTHSGSGSSSTTVSFATGSKDPSFTISQLNSKINGNPNSRYIDQVSVSYVNGSGNTVNYGAFSGSNVSSVNVDINGEVQSLTVSLADGYDGNYGGTLSVSLSSISYCSAAPACPDADNDGVCDVDDVCPGFDDGLIGTSCSDGDVCTENDVYGSDCLCAGTYADSDGDGVCDGEDICPGGDDSVDSDGDGIPDFCDNSNCSNEVTSNFSPNPLTHQGTGSASATVSIPTGNTDVNFTISGIDNQLSGNKKQRYRDQVTVTYVNGAGNTVIEGIYATSGGQSSLTVDISISGAVQSVTVSLTDIYDGDSENAVLSVNMSNVTSCSTAIPALQETQENSSITTLVTDIQVFPNPVRNQLSVQLNGNVENGKIVITNLLGAKIGEYVLNGESKFLINMQDLKLSSQSLFVSLEVPGQSPIVKKILYIK